jgi:hypothetical protein
VYGGFIKEGYGLTINIYNKFLFKINVEILMVSTEPETKLSIRVTK